MFDWEISEAAWEEPFVGAASFCVQKLNIFFTNQLQSFQENIIISYTTPIIPFLPRKIHWNSSGIPYLKNKKESKMTSEGIYSQTPTA